MDVTSRIRTVEEMLFNVQARFGSEAIGLVSGRDIVAAAKEVDSIVLAANARHPLVIKVSVRRKEENAAVLDRTCQVRVHLLRVEL